MNFSFCANMSGFCSDSHIYHPCNPFLKIIFGLKSPWKWCQDKNIASYIYVQAITLDMSGYLATYVYFLTKLPMM